MGTPEATDLSLLKETLPAIVTLFICSVFEGLEVIIQYKTIPKTKVPIENISLELDKTDLTLRVLTNLYEMQPEIMH